MQNKILIIGNGFDLYHKLPTRYKDFLFFANHWKEFKEEYDKYNIPDAGMTNDMIKVQLGDNNELTLESLKDFAKHADRYSKDHIAYLDEHIQNNDWLNYFNKITPQGQNWIDFEMEIERALKQVELFYGDTLTHIDGHLPVKDMPDQMQRVIFTFSEKAEKLGLGYKNLAKKILHHNDTDSESLKSNKALLLESMKNELDALNMCLNYYLLEFVSVIHSGVYSEQIKDLGNIFLLNFNYINTYEAVYGKKELIQHHPIHGEAKEENLVFGISDEDFPDTLDYVYFQKYFQRIQKKTGNFYKEWPVCPEYSTLEDMPAQVFIMGHSLSKVDKGVLKDFFNERNVELIKIFYHSQSGYENQVVNLVDMFGRDFVIDQTGKGRIIFEELRPPVEGKPRLE